MSEPVRILRSFANGATEEQLALMERRLTDELAARERPTLAAA